MISDIHKANLLKTELDSRLASLSSLFRAQAEKEDPIGLVYPYIRRDDIEVVALLASCLSYGQRKVFVPLVKGLLNEMGASPYSFVMEQGYLGRFEWFKYRFNVADDLQCLFHSLRSVLLSFGSLESLFTLTGYDTKSSLTSLVDSFRSVDFSVLGLPSHGTKGFQYLLPSPDSGGACKRLNMFLRWMCRKDEVDFGIWSGIPLHSLVIPLDTHVHRVSRGLGLTTKTGSTWSTSLDITQSLLTLDPVDPLKYDFLLFSMGVWREL